MGLLSFLIVLTFIGESETLKFGCRYGRRSVKNGEEKFGTQFVVNLPAVQQLSAIAMATTMGVLFLGTPTPAFATDGQEAGDKAATLVFKSGKNPVRNVDKEDKTGTKTDKKFLKCLSGCKSTCEQPTGGPAVQRVDCIQDCQDQCCDSYEQCSYKIKIGSSGGI